MINNKFIYWCININILKWILFNDKLWIDSTFLESKLKFLEIIVIWFKQYS